MGPEFVNAYVTRLINEIQELVKTKLLLQTQLEITEKINQELSAQLDKYRQQEEKATKKLAKKDDNQF